MSTGDILHCFILLPFLAALLCENCHHSRGIDIFHAHNLQCLGGQLLVLGRGKELIEILDFADEDFRGQLFVLEFLHKHRFIESSSFNNDVISFLSLDKEAIFSDLEKSLNEVFCNFLWIRIFLLQLSNSIDIPKLIFELQEVSDSLGSTKEASLSLCNLLVLSYFQSGLNLFKEHFAESGKIVLPFKHVYISYVDSGELV